MPFDSNPFRDALQAHQRKLVEMVIPMDKGERRKKLHGEMNADHKESLRMLDELKAHIESHKSRVTHHNIDTHDADKADTIRHHIGKLHSQFVRY